MFTKRRVHTALLYQPHLEPTWLSTDRAGKRLVACTQNRKLSCDENKPEPHTALWVSPIDRVLSKRSQTQERTHPMTHWCGCGTRCQNPQGLTGLVTGREAAGCRSHNTADPWATQSELHRSTYTWIFFTNYSWPLGSAGCPPSAGLHNCQWTTVFSHSQR